MLNDKQFGDYGDQHRPDEEGAPLHDLTGGGTHYPEDVYGPKGERIYSFGQHDNESLGIARNYRGKPDQAVNIYRAVPKGVTNINPGDWVSVSRNYAKEHGERRLGRGNYSVLKQSVPAKHVKTSADSLSEWGYFPEKP